MFLLSSEVSGREGRLIKRSWGERSEGLGGMSAIGVYDLDDEVGVVAFEVGCEDMGIGRGSIAIDLSDEIDKRLGLGEDEGELCIVACRVELEASDGAVTGLEFFFELFRGQLRADRGNAAEERVSASEVLAKFFALGDFGGFGDQGV